MKKFSRNSRFLALLVLGSLFSSCQAIAAIFKAGVWFGVIGVIVIIVVIFWLVSKAGKK